MGRRRGFTLMEMLAVVAILAIAAAIAVPAVGFLRDSWILRQRNAQARTVYLAAQARLSGLRASGGLDILEVCPQAVPQMGESLPEGLQYTATGDGMFSRLLPEEFLEDGVNNAQILIEFDGKTGTVAGVFFYQGNRSIPDGYRAGQLPRDAKQRRKLLLGYYASGDLPDAAELPETLRAEIVFENGQDARLTVLVPTQTADFQDVTWGDYTGFLEDLEITLTITGERGGEVKTCIKPRGTAENCRPGSTEGGMEAVAVTTLLDSLRWTGSFGGGIAPGDNVSVAAEVSATRVQVESAALPGINPLFGSLTEDGSGGLRLNITNGRHLQNLNKLAPTLAGKVSAVVFTGPEGTVGKGEGIRIDWQDTSDYYGGLRFTPISNEALLEAADFIGNEAAICNLKIEAEGDAGLFVCLNTAVDSLYLVNPIISSGEGAAGALAARTGENARITNCGSFCETAGTIQGQTAGGLVGICEAGTEFTRCFGAVNVKGCISGGFAGTVSGTAFDRCYASGTVTGTDSSGGFLGRGEISTFLNCFATGDAAGMEAVGGFAGQLTAEGEILLASCYSLGLAIRDDAVFENFCGETVGNPAGLSDYYKGYAEAVLSGVELTDYRFKDCYYLAGNCPGAAYDNGASRVWANPADYDTLGNIRSSGKILLEYLLETPFDSRSELEQAKAFLAGLDEDLGEILETNQDCGTYRLYFDAAKQIFGDTTLNKTYRKAYSAAFPAKVWEFADDPFPVLKGLPYYGTWPGRGSTGDFGVLYYERLENGLNLRQIRLSDGQETASRTGTGRVLEAGYGLYFTPGSKPFSEETSALAGAELKGLLPDAVTVRSLPQVSPADEAGNPIPLKVSARYWGKTVTVVPEFADTLNQTGEAYKIRCQSQLEAVARYPGLDYVLEGEIHLDESYASLPEFRGSLTGTGEILFADGRGGLVDILAGGTLDGIRVRGSLTLSGTAGVLANRITEGGSVRDCTVNGEITLESGEIFGPVVGILEDGSILRTRTEASVTGTATCIGAFLGQALGGKLEDCRAPLPEEAIAFAGFAASEESPIENATHFSSEVLESSRVAPEDLDAMTTPTGKISYAAVFENCAFAAGELLLDALETRHYYRLTPMGGWNRALWESGELPRSGKFLPVTQSGDLLMVKNGQLFRENRWDLAGLNLEDFWTATGNSLQCGDFSVTAAPGSEGCFTLSWQEPVTVRWKSAGEAEFQILEADSTRQVECQLYRITENTDCRAVYLETVRQLWVPWEDL